MLEADKDVLLVPYPLKTLAWDKIYKRMKDGKVKMEKTMSKDGNCLAN
jgi:hypothetical protein